MKSRGRVDSQIIDVNQPLALRHYTRAFGCTEQQLRAAIAVVGARAANVRMRFRRRPLVRHHRSP